jgi:hypothetical protein
MGAILKKAGLAAILLDLQMSAAALEQLLAGPGSARPTCSADQNEGFDYLCQNGGARALYDVAADHVMQRLELP